MAKRKRKPRTPPPPRRPQSDAAQTPRVQAPQVRKKEKRERSSDQQERRARITLYALGGSGIVGLIAVIAFFALRSGGGGTSEAALGAKFSAAGCSYRTNPGVVVKNSHTNNIKDKIKYASYPPTNGKHYFDPARWDFYTQPVPPIQVVHNMEHGGVIVWYGQKVPQATVQKLQEFYNEHPVSMLVTPLAKFDSKIAITAWTKTVEPVQYGTKPTSHYYGEGHLAVCSKFDNNVLDAFRTFRDDFIGKGPEGIPESVNQPGTQQ